MQKNAPYELWVILLDLTHLLVKCSDVFLHIDLVQLAKSLRYKKLINQ